MESKVFKRSRIVCSVCGKPAVIHLAYARRSLCGKHFVEYLESRVEKTIKRYHLVKKGSRILVAVSGGKDSATLLHILAKLSGKLDFTVIALHIDLGITQYSEKLKEVFAKLVEDNKVEAIIIELKKVLNGDGIPELARKARRPPCSVCGMIKRYLMNLVASIIEADYIATGHNMDDMLAYALKDFIYMDLDQLAKHGPSTTKRGPAIGRIRPLYEISEKEILVYAKEARIPFLEEHCPLRPKKSIEQINKEYLSKLEEEYPGLKISIARRIARASSRLLDTNWTPNKCKYCGQPAQGDVCSFCKLTKKVYGKPLGPYMVEYVRRLVAANSSKIRSATTRSSLGEDSSY